MGNPGIYLVYLNGKYAVAKYSGIGGYPTGHGMTVLKFVYNTDNLVHLKAALSTPGMVVNVDAYDMDRCHDPSHPFASAHIGGEILSIIAGTACEVHISYDLKHLPNTDWAYVIDLDKHTFEVYSSWTYLDGKRQTRFGPEMLKREGEPDAKFLLMGKFSLADLPGPEQFTALQTRERIGWMDELEDEGQDANEDNKKDEGVEDEESAGEDEDVLNKGKGGLVDNALRAFLAKYGIQD